jgi:hypothetical protein
MGSAHVRTAASASTTARAHATSGASIHDRSEPSTQRARIAARPSGIANVGQVLTSRSPTIHFIAPGATHVTMVFEKSPLIGSVVVDLLDAKAS